MAENTGEGLKPIPKASAETKSLVARETGSLAPEGLERIYDLKQTERLLKSVGSELPQKQKRELDESVSSRLAELVGWNLDPTSLNPSDRKQLSEFLSKWDGQTPEAQKARVLTALELLGTEKIDPKALEQKRQAFVNEVATIHETQRRQNVKALSDKEIRQWDELRSKQTLKPEDRMRLDELRQRASQELAKALGPLGMRKGALPLLTNPQVRKDYEKLLTDEKTVQKIEALKLRLQIGKATEQAKEAPAPFTHQKLQELLLKRITDTKKTLQTSGDYRLWVIPMNGLKHAEEQLIPTIIGANRDLDGTLRLVQSIIDVREQFAYTDIPRVGALRELAGILPKETGVSENSGLSEIELTQRKTETLRQLDELKDIFKRSGNQRLWMLPNQICDTARTLVEEIKIGGDNPSEHGMIRVRLNTVEGINKHYRGLYLRK